jgi:hypothetical protein
MGFDVGPTPGSITVSLHYSHPISPTGGVAGTPGTSYATASATGTSVAGALSVLARGSAGRLWLGSTRILCFGEAMARRGVREVVGYLMLHPQMSDRTLAIVVQGRAASFLARPAPTTGSGVSHVVEMLEGASTSDISGHAVSLFRLFDQAFAETGAVATPYFVWGANGPERSGLAVFRGDRVVALVPAAHAGIVAAIWRPGPGMVDLPAADGLPPLHLRAALLRTEVRPAGRPDEWVVSVTADRAVLGDLPPARAQEAVERPLLVGARLAAAALAELEALYRAGADVLDLGGRYRQRSRDGRPPPLGWWRRQRLVVEAVVRPGAVEVGT